MPFLSCGEVTSLSFCFCKLKKRNHSISPTLMRLKRDVASEATFYTVEKYKIFRCFNSGLCHKDSHGQHHVTSSLWYGSSLAYLLPFYLLGRKHSVGHSFWLLSFPRTLCKISLHQIPFCLKPLEWFYFSFLLTGP